MKLKNILTGRIFNVNPFLYKDLMNSGNIKNFEILNEIPEDLKDYEGKTLFSRELYQKDGEFYFGDFDENGNLLPEKTIPEDGVFPEQILKPGEFKTNLNEDFDNETESDNQIGDFDVNDFKKNEDEILKSLEVKTETENDNENPKTDEVKIETKKTRGPYKKK